MKTMVDKIIKFMFAGKIMFGAQLRHILAPAATHNARAQSYLQQNSFRRHSTWANLCLQVGSYEVSGRSRGGVLTNEREEN